MSRPSKRQRRTEVKVGAIRVPWYRAADGRTFVDFRHLQQLAPTERRLRTFVDHDTALRAARAKAIELNAAGSEGQVLTAEDRGVFAQARAIVQTRGLSLLDALAEWKTAREILAGHPFTLAESVAAGVESLHRPAHPVGNVVLELLASKAAQPLNRRYERGLRTTLQNFAAGHSESIDRITPQQIEAFLTQFEVGARRRNNMLKEVRHLFAFARKRGYLPDRVTAASRVEIIKRVKSTIGIVTPAAMQLYLDHVDRAFLPWLVINAFSGVRTEEICLTKDASRAKDPLRWEDFDWPAREICVREETAKTGVPRRVPIADNLLAWLAPWRDARASGPVCPPRTDGSPARPDHERTRFIRVAQAAQQADHGRKLVELHYPHNGFRHSYGSYRMAQIKDMQRLSYEMGNSVAMIKRNYHNPRPESEAHAWFAIFPPHAPGNILQLDLALSARNAT